jgi:uncharacterized membrane protein
MLHILHEFSSIHLLSDVFVIIDILWGAVFSTTTEVRGVLSWTLTVME